MTTICIYKHLLGLLELLGLFTGLQSHMFRLLSNLAIYIPNIRVIRVIRVSRVIMSGLFRVKKTI